ncbi:hypothetical protein BH11MYX2_BH11MYX2_21740 [soil metagenome]
MSTFGRTYTAGRFALDIDGYNVGFLKKWSGLSMEANVVANDLGPDNLQKKHVSNIKWTHGKATVGIGMGKGMYEWIKAAFDKGFVRKNGTLTAADFDYKAQSQLTFMQALITGVTVPKLSGDSNDAAYFDIEFEAEQVRWAKAGGEVINGKIGPKQKAWLCQNFRVEIGDLPCNRIASVDSFTWKCGVAPDQIGTTKEPEKVPSKVLTPDIKFAINYADHQAWADAARKWFIDGEHEEANEMTGRIVFLKPNMKDELGSIDLVGLGFKKFADDDAEANSEKIKRFNVEMYCEGMKFNLNYTDS